MEIIDDQLKINMMTRIFHEIERRKGDNDDMSYIDAIISYCEDNDVDIESFGNFIKTIPSLKSQIEIEAENLNFLNKTSRLPV